MCSFVLLCVVCVLRSEQRAVHEVRGDRSGVAGRGAEWRAEGVKRAERWSAAWREGEECVEWRGGEWSAEMRDGEVKRRVSAYATCEVIVCALPVG